MINIFLSYPYKDASLNKSLDFLMESFKSLGYKIIRPFDIELNNNSYLFNKVIESCDLVVVILTKDSANTFIELGYALGKGKKVILVKQNDIETPYLLKEVPLVIGDLSDCRIQNQIIKTAQAVLSIRNDKHAKYKSYLQFIDLLHNTVTENKPKRYDADILSKYHHWLRPFENSKPVKLTTDMSSVINLLYDDIQAPSSYEKLIFLILRANFNIDKVMKNEWDRQSFDFLISDYNKYKHTLCELKTVNESSFISLDSILKFYDKLNENKADCGIYITNSNYSNSVTNFCKNLKGPTIYLWTFEMVLEKAGIEKAITSDFLSIWKLFNEERASKNKLIKEINNPKRHHLRK